MGIKRRWALNEQGTAQFKDGHYDQALALFGRAVQLDPDFVVALNNLSIAIMGAAKANSVMQNDARDNNLSGLTPCVHCNLVDLSTGLGDPNVFERNLGTFNLTDSVCLIP